MAQHLVDPLESRAIPQGKGINRMEPVLAGLCQGLNPPCDAQQTHDLFVCLHHLQARSWWTSVQVNPWQPLAEQSYGVSFDSVVDKPFVELENISILHFMFMLPGQSGL